MEIATCRFCHKAFTVPRSGDYQCPHCAQTQSVILGSKPPPSPARGSAATTPLDSVIEGALRPEAPRPYEGPGFQSPSDSTSPPRAQPVSWEERAHLGVYAGIKETITRVLKEPAQFFRTMPRQGKVGDAVLYGVIMMSLGSYLTVLWQIPGKMLSGSNPWERLLPFMPDLGGLVFAFFFAGILIVIPMISLVGIFLSAGLTHLFLHLVGGAQHDFSATLRLLSYAQTPSIWRVVPFCGEFISPIWVLVTFIIGLREVQTQSTGKAVLVAFLPVIVCCCLPLIGVATLLGTVGLDALKNFPFGT